MTVSQSIGTVCIFRRGKLLIEVEKARSAATLPGWLPMEPAAESKR